MSAVEATYSMLGIPGAFSSMDVVHLAWAIAPCHLKHMTTGKEGYPSIA